MSTWVVEAVYQDGVIKPLKPLSLPENVKVQVRIKPLFPPERMVKWVLPQPAPHDDLGPLAGAFPELAAITDQDLAWAKQQWERGVDKQVLILADKATDKPEEPA